jgi:integrase
MEVTFYLKNPKATKSVVFAQITYHSQRLKYYFGESIEVKFWDEKKRRAVTNSKFPTNPEFNYKLENISNTIKNCFRKFQNENELSIPLPSTLKALLDNEIKGKEEVLQPEYNIISYGNYLIQLSKDQIRLTPKNQTPYTSGTLKAYQTSLQRFTKYCIHYKCKLNFDEIDNEFYINYKAFAMEYLNISNNSIGQDIKTLKLIMTEALEEKLHNNLSFKSKKFARISEESDSIYLSEKELQQLKKLELNNDLPLDRVRDLFLINCYTGLRYSDVIKIKPSDFESGYLQIKQQKTGENIVIPLHQTVKDILNKYEGNIPKPLTNQKMNLALKEIGKKMTLLNQTISKTINKGGIKITTELPKYELLSTHVGRRTFCTNAFLNSIPALTIMAISGHKTEKAFIKYIKLKNQDHAKMLEEIWTKNNNY